MDTTTFVFIFMIPRYAAQSAIFHMTGMLQSPPPQAGITSENSTVSLYGLSSEKWTISELYFSDKILCRNFPGSGSCRADEDFPTIRLGGVQVLGVNETACGYQLSGLASRESGKWKIRMGKLVAGEMMWDYMEIIMRVSQQSTVSLNTLPSSNTVSQNSSYVSCYPGTSLAIQCAGHGARPAVDSFTWGITNMGYWQVEYGEVLHMGQENTSQVVAMVTSRLGVYTLSCAPVQVCKTICSRRRKDIPLKYNCTYQTQCL